MCSVNFTQAFSKAVFIQVNVAGGSFISVHVTILRLYGAWQLYPKDTERLSWGSDAVCPDSSIMLGYDSVIPLWQLMSVGIIQEKVMRLL